MAWIPSAIADVAKAGSDHATHAADFSQLDLFLGLIIGIATTGIVTAIVVWSLLKARVITLGGAGMAIPIAGGSCDGGPAEHLVRIQIPRDCNEHKAERERSLRNEAAITKLFRKYDAMANQIAAGMETLQSNQVKLLMGLVQCGVLDSKYIPDTMTIGRFTRRSGEEEP